MRTDIATAEWVSCLERFRSARALVLRDAESFHEAAMALEYAGQLLCGEIRNGLGAYKDELTELAKNGKSAQPAHVTSLFHVVKEARNMAVHEGAWVRHLGSRLIELMLLLEEGIVKHLKCAEDVMVRSPVVAEPWQMVSHIRRLMLENSFSFLPIKLQSGWHIISDLELVRFLKADPAHEKDRLSMQIGAAIESGQLPAEKAACCHPRAEIGDVVKRVTDHPLLITQEVDGDPYLLGLIMPFDLL